MELSQMLDLVLHNRASDLHLIEGAAPILRIDGELAPLVAEKQLTKDEVQNLVNSLLTDQQKELFSANKELDFSFSYSDQARFRVNVYHQKGSVAASLRLIPIKIPNIEELNLPDILHSLIQLKQGFILVTGPTGHGKSTTLAAMINEINTTRRSHIITLEDPIEYIFAHGLSIVSQREMHLDTFSWDVALRSALREDPDVVLIGEMRDYETIATALTVAETGHLVLATLHTNSASQTVDRVVGVFPQEQQDQVRLQLANTLEGIVSQRLIPQTSGGRIPAVEILTGSAAVRNVIREGKTHLIDNIIQTSGDLSMVSLDKSLAALVNSNKIRPDVALAYSLHPDLLMTFLHGGRKTKD
ncbi:MAG: type IV pilus twitching motility protein PilT [Patescibacteria group bacterium]|nr:type IV pilus twitching motility protein PilT [Patescibacteria group bacterium]